MSEVWTRTSSMLAEAPELEAKALFEFLAAEPGSGLKPGHLRTFKRRVRQWLGTVGPEREVMFGQSPVPGGLLEVDWTHPGQLRVTVQGQPLDHLLCHGVLAYSNWQWAVRCQSESFLSLVAGVQACLSRMGKVPRCLGTDNSSAAPHEIDAGKRAYNPDYLDLCTHYDLSPLTINVGCPTSKGTWSRPVTPIGMIHARLYAGVGFVLRNEDDPMNQPASCLGKTWEPRVAYLHFSWLPWMISYN